MRGRRSRSSEPESSSSRTRTSKAGQRDVTLWRQGTRSLLENDLKSPFDPTSILTEKNQMSTAWMAQAMQ